MHNFKIIDSNKPTTILKTIIYEVFGYINILCLGVMLIGHIGTVAGIIFKGYVHSL